MSRLITRGFIVLECGHWAAANVSSDHIWQLGAMVDCSQCRTWRAISVVTG